MRFLQLRRADRAERAAVRGTPSAAIGRPGNLQTATINYVGAGVSRDAAMTVPTIKMGRDLIVGAAVQMGIYRYRGSERLEPGSLLGQPDPDTTWAATLAGTIDDLIFNGRAYWLVLAFDGVETEAHPRGLPVRARWIPFDSVTPEVESGSLGAYSMLDGYHVNGIAELVPPDEMIRFDGTLPGVLAVGGPSIAAALKLENAADRFASVELPAGVLINEGSQLGDEEAEALVQKFQTARATNVVAFLQGVAYERTDINPHDLQLVEGRNRWDTEMARLMNMPVTMVSASPSGNAASMLYSNLSSQLAVFVSNAVAPHLRCVEATLSLPSVTPRGQRIAFDIQTFLRSDPQALADYVTSLYAADLIDRDEGRSFLGIPTSVASTDLTPGRV